MQPLKRKRKMASRRYKSKAAAKHMNFILVNPCPIETCQGFSKRPIHKSLEDA